LRVNFPAITKNIRAEKTPEDLSQAFGTRVLLADFHHSIRENSAGFGLRSSSNPKSNMAKSIAPRRLREHWINKKEIALLDVREEGPYSESHPLWAISVPVSEIEKKLPALVPRLSAPIVVYDDGEKYVARAAARISALGYRDVSILEGGLTGYSVIGEVYRDVGVPSKAFGELVESINHTPSMSASEVKNVLESESDVVVLDARRFEEYNTMSIPRGRSCPGGELLYRVFEAVPSPETTVIVNCAGRTRSIVGTQSLINSRIPNKVVALRNGTIGWTLEGLELETKKTERVPQPSVEASQKARLHADSWAKYVGVSFIDEEKLLGFAAESEDRSLYLLDVRDPEEYALGHPAGFSNAPGGQLVQATEEWVGVRGARIILYDTDGVRARMTASWLLQLGWEVHVLDERSAVPPSLSIADPHSLDPLPSGSLTVDALRSLREATIVDLARSPLYSKGHIPGAWFASGPEIIRDLTSVSGDGPIVLTSSDGIIAAANLEYARNSLQREILYVAGGTAAWVAAGHSLETESRWLSQPIDIYKRPYEGTSNARKDMQGYLDWEYGLVAQLANDGVSGFHVVRDRREQSGKLT
jgi:rhodanese-related sulfurtransferase